MSQIALRKRIFTTSQVATLFGSLGAIAIDKTKNTLVLFDGSTLGGHPLALETHVHANATDSVAGFESAADHVYLYNHTHTNATVIAAGFMSAADKANLDALVAAGGGSSTAQTSANVPNTLVLRDGSGNFAAGVISAALNGNASTVTNGIVSSGSYANPAWITSLDGAKITGTIGAGVTFAGSVPWTSVTGKPSVVSYFVNDSGYINGSGNTTGTSGGVQSAGGRETASPTANTVILRDGSGRAQVQAPVANADIATKAYVDANAGGFAYYPTAIIGSSIPFVANSSNAPFSQTVLNESANGIIKAIWTLHETANGGPDPRSFAYLGITIDGRPETVISWADLLDYYWTFQVNKMHTEGNVFRYMTQLDIPYKISAVVRFFTTTTVVTGADPNLQIAVNRYLRAS